MGLVSSLAGKNKGDLGDLAGLVTGFSKLGLNAEMVGKFASTLIEFVQKKGDNQLLGMLQKIITPSK